MSIMAFWEFIKFIMLAAVVIMLVYASNYLDLEIEYVITFWLYLF